MTIRTVATLLALAVVLPGCTSDEKVPSVLPPAPSTSPGPTGGAESPVAIPPEAGLETPEGASAFVRFYLLRVVNEAFAKGDAATVRGLSHAQCESCANLIDAIDSEGTPGERIEGGDYVVSSVASPAGSKGEVTVLVTYELTAVRVFDSAGQILRERPAEPAVVATMSLGRTADRWSVLSFVNVDQ